MAATCPKCGGKLRLIDWKPNCPHCGVNMVYYGMEERLLLDADKAEAEHARTQPKVDRIKAATVGSPLAIARLVISLIPIGLTQAYGGTLRDLGSTKVPMFASVCAILVNLTGNYLLIYGHLGLPALGASGAAIATVISRFVELAILAIYTNVINGL